MATAPPEKELIAALQQYAREGLPLQRRIVHLREDFGYKIGRVRIGGSLHGGG